MLEACKLLHKWEIYCRPAIYFMLRQHHKLPFFVSFVCVFSHRIIFYHFSAMIIGWIQEENYHISHTIDNDFDISS